MYSPGELFNRWYTVPLRALESLPNGDGAFVALTVSCALYERYAAAVLKKCGRKADEAGKLGQFMNDFSTDKATANVFWDVIRNGLTHEAMPLQEKKHPRWLFHHSHCRPFELEEVNGRPTLKVQPWKFMNTVISLWEENISLLADSKSFPWGNTDVPPYNLDTAG